MSESARNQHVSGTMIFKGTRQRVVDACWEPLLYEIGVRDGWNATTDDVIGARMFYPADMYTFEADGSCCTTITGE